MNIILKYIYYIFGINTNKPINKRKRKYNLCVDKTNIIYGKRVRRIPIRYSIQKQ